MREEKAEREERKSDMRKIENRNKTKKMNQKEEIGEGTCRTASSALLIGTELRVPKRRVASFEVASESLMWERRWGRAALREGRWRWDRR